MKEDLKQYLKDRPFKGPFRPHASFNRLGMAAHVWLEDKDCVSSRVNEALTVHRCANTGAVVGVTVHGVAWMEMVGEGQDSAVPRSNKAPQCLPCGVIREDDSGLTEILFRTEVTRADAERCCESLSQNSASAKYRVALLIRR